MESMGSETMEFHGSWQSMEIQQNPDLVQIFPCRGLGLGVIALGYLCLVLTLGLGAWGCNTKLYSQLASAW